MKHSPVVVTKIEDKDGNIIYKADEQGQRVLSEEVSGATTSVLKQVFEASDGTAQTAKLENGQPVAGKTGTSTDFADHWLVGYTPSISVATWIGNPEGSISTDHNLNCNALWKDFMDRATSGKEVKQFAETKAPNYANSFNDKQKASLGAEEDSSSSNQTPTSITSGTTVVSSSNSTTPPDATGKTLSEAKTLLKDWKASSITEYSSTVAKDSVIRQYIDSDGSIVVVLSTGPKTN